MSGACPAAIQRANEHRAWIAKTYHRLSVAEQAQARDLSVHHVRTLRAELMHAGQLSATKRRNCRVWTGAEWASVVARLRDGATTAEAGGRRSAAAVELEAGRRGTSIAAIRAGYVWAANTLATALGVDYTVVMRWLRTGVLIKARGGFVMRITRQSVERVLADRMQWPFFDPDQIVDPHLRAYARGERIKAGGDWLPAKMYAATRGYTLAGIRRRLRDGLEPVVCARIGYEWFVWEDRR